ncbi:MAG: small basic protein [Planctomycetes bacterium]|nr:small basic protein [Planctomycetota bacterium]
MSLHQSLKAAGGLIKHRNVLNKRERIEKLIDSGKWDEKDAVAFGLPKVRNIKITSKKGGAKKKEEGEEAAQVPEGTEAQPQA